jgi:hypothetical protein
MVVEKLPSGRQKSVPSVIVRNEVTKQSIDQSMFLDCFASLAMTENEKEVLL